MTHQIAFLEASLAGRVLRAVCLALTCLAPLVALSSCSSSDSPGAAAAGGALGWSGGSSMAGAGSPGSGGSGATSGVTGLGGGSADGGAGQTGTGGDLGGRAGDTGSAGETNGAGGSGASGGSSGAGAAGGAGGASGASGASGLYDPCPPKGTVCKIMPMGDSITEGFRASDNRGGYRSRLFHLTLLNKQAITFVGSAPLWGPSTVDGVPFPKQNEGIGGRRIEDLINIVPATSTASKPNTVIVNKPNILLLEIGTNNIHDGATSMASKLGTLLDLIVGSDPSLLVVLAQIIPDRVDADIPTIEAYNASMKALVKSRADAGKHIILADMFTPIYSNSSFKTALMSDDLHPNDAGYTVMAQAWYDTLKSYLH